MANPADDFSIPGPDTIDWDYSGGFDPNAAGFSPGLFSNPLGGTDPLGNMADTTLMTPPSAGPSMGGGSGGMGFGNLNLGQMIGLGTAGITALTGLAGVIQRAMAGDEQSRQTLQRTIQTASPQEQQAIAQAIQGLQQQMQLGGQTQGLIGGMSGLNIPGQQQSNAIPGQQAPFNSQMAGALGQGFAGSAEFQGQGQDLSTLTRNLYANVLGRAASDQEVQSWAQTGNPQTIIQGILGSPEFAQRGVPLNQAITNLYQGTLGRTPGASEVQGWQQQLGAPDTPAQNLPIPMELQAQQGALNQLGGGVQRFNQFSQGALPIINQMMQGGLNLDGAVGRTVEQAFQPQMGDIATQAIESARRRGFAGGSELLQQGPAGAIAGPALADLQGQMAAAKLGLAQQLPMQALSGFGQLQNLNQNLVASLGGVAQQGINNRNTTQGVQTGGLQQLGQIGNILGNQRQNQITQTGTTTTPGSGLLGAAQGLGQIGQGVGNVLDVFGRQNLWR